MRKYVPPQKRNQIKPTAKPVQLRREITKTTCMQCGNDNAELMEFKRCNSCLSYCEICHKKRCEYGIQKAIRCIDCQFLGDNCFVK